MAFDRLLRRFARPRRTSLTARFRRRQRPGAEGAGYMDIFDRLFRRR